MEGKVKIQRSNVELLVETVIERNNHQGMEAAVKVAAEMLETMGAEIETEDD